MSETPPRNQQPNRVEPKTPGWFSGLFSSAKKPSRQSVESSTDSTGAAVSSPTFAKGFVANGVGRGMDPIELKTPSERMPPSTSNTTNETIDFLDPKSPTTMNGSNLFPQTSSSTTAMSRAKSRWRSSTVRTNGSISRPVPQPHLKAPPPSSSTTAKNRGLTPSKATAGRRRKRWKPSVLLVPPKKRAKTSIDVDRATKALLNSKGLIMDASREQQLQQYDTSIRPGRRMMGSQQRGSRMNNSVRDDSVENQVTMERSNKRQKKVLFNDDDEAPIQSLINTTPVRDSSTIIGRKQTPHSNPPSKQYEPLPEVDLFVKGPPYTDFGSIEELESLGPAVSGGERVFWSFGSASPAGTNIAVTSTALTYDDTNIPPMKDDEPKEGPSQADDDGTPSTQDKKRRKTGDTKTGVAANIWGNDYFEKLYKENWKCANCSVLNSNDLAKCVSCEGAKGATEGTGKTSAEGTGTAAALPPPPPPPPAEGSIGASGFSFKTPSSSSSGNAGGSLFTTNASTTGGFTAGTDQATGPGFIFAPPAASGAAASSTSAAAFGTSSGFTFSTGNAKTEEGEVKESTTGGNSKPTAFTFGTGTTASGTSSNATTETKPLFGQKPDSSTPENGNKSKFQFSSQGNQGTPSFNFGGKKTTPEPKRPTESQVPATEPAAKRTRPVSNEEKPQPNSASKVTFGATQPDASGNAAPKAWNLFPSGSAPHQFGKQPGSDAAPPSASASTPIIFGGAAAASSDSSNRNEDSDRKSKRRRDRGGDDDTKTGNTSVPATSSTPGFSGPFGNTSTPAAPSTGPLFGGTAPASTSKSGNGDASAPFSFGSAAAAAAPAKPFSFGAPSSDENASGQTSNTTASAGPFAGQPAPALGPAASFAGQPAAAPAGTSVPSFGNQQASTPAAPTTFGTNPSQSNAPFGSLPAAPAPAPFGSTTTTFGTNPGQSNASASASTTATGFGSTPAPATTATGFGSTPAPATTGTGFGSAPAQQVSNAAPFGQTQTQSNAAPFGSATGPQFGSTPSAPPGPFGTNPAPQSNAAPFGNTTAAAPQFGAATPSAPPGPFGSTSSAANPTFGSTPANAPAPPPFGQGSAPFGSPAPAPFGATAAPFGGGGGGFGGGNPATPGAPGGFNTTTPQQQPAAFGGGTGGFGTPGSMANANMGMGPGAPQFSIGTGGKTPGTRRKIRARRPPSNRQA